MIKSTFEESHDQEWIKKNITAPVHELVILRQVIPWSEIITRLASFYDPQKGCYGKSLRILVALLLVSRLRQLSDEQVVIQTKENRYIQYFCNVPDNGLQTFLDASTLCKFRKRIGEKGLAIIEEETFDLLRTSGSIQGETCLMDSSVLPNNIIYPMMCNCYSKPLASWCLLPRNITCASGGISASSKNIGVLLD